MKEKINLNLATIILSKEDYKYVTHPGVFHTDEVMATAILSLLEENEMRVNRLDAREIPENREDLIVYDVGNGKYDHHTGEKKRRSTGELYSSAGLIWDDYGMEVLKKLNENHKKYETNITYQNLSTLHQRLDKEIFIPIDAADNGDNSYPKSPYRIITESMVYMEDLNSAFIESVNIMKQVLYHTLMKEIDSLHKEKLLEHYISNNNQELTKEGILVLERFLPWERFLAENKDSEGIRLLDKFFYVLHPSARGGWIATAVAEEPGLFKNKKPFNEQWRGKSNFDLQDITGLKTSIFCHMNGFCYIAEDLEDVISACKITLGLIEHEVNSNINCNW